MGRRIQYCRKSYDSKRYLGNKLPRHFFAQICVKSRKIKHIHGLRSKLGRDFESTQADMGDKYEKINVTRRM